MPNKDVHLIPFKVQNVQEKANEYIPEGILMTHAPDQWLKGNEGEGIVVAVIDTGVDYYHTDLMGNIIGGMDFTGKGDYLDGNGHGTHVAGTICATATGKGIVGIAPKAKILALKALSDDGSGDMNWVLQALRYAIDQNVHVINMSLGGPHVRALHSLVKEAKEKGIVIVAAAGNEGDGDAATEELSYPGAYPEVIQVGAVNTNKELAYFSNTNMEVDLLADGVQVLSTYPGGQYARLDGTSMAAPHVAGAAALLLSINASDYHRGDQILDIGVVEKQEPIVEPGAEPEQNPVVPDEPLTPEAEEPVKEPVQEEKPPLLLPAPVKPSNRLKRLLRKLLRRFNKRRN